MKRAVDHRGRAVHLGAEVGRGGEGAVYAIEGDGARVAKIYHAKIDVNPARIAKLRAMVATASGPLSKIAAWPEAVLHDPTTKQVVGFTMPRLTGYRELHELYSPMHRRVHFPDADWSFLLHVAMNAAAAIGSVHTEGHVVGDVNSKNICVGTDGRVKLIDCDSFAIAYKGAVYPCPVGVVEYTPPELQMVNLDGVVRTANHDNFGLGVLIFQLLFLGRHPFFGVPKEGGAAASITDAIREGIFAYGRRALARGVLSPPQSLALDAVPAAVVALFERAFGASAGGVQRPPAAEWHKALRAMKDGLKRCASALTHRYPAHLARCPWCELADRTAMDFFPGQHSRVKTASLTGFRSDIAEMRRLWEQVEQWAVLQDAERPRLEVGPQLRGPVPDLGPVRVRLERVATNFQVAAWVLAAATLSTLVTPLGWAAVALAAVGAMVTGRRSGALRKDPFGAQLARIESSVTLTKERLAEVEIALASVEAKARAALEVVMEKAHHLCDSYLELEEICAEWLRSHASETPPSQRENFQLEAHVRSASIKDAGIAKLGASHYRLLASFGVETAYDVLTVNLSELPNSGSALEDLLDAWAERVRASFVFDPSPTVTPAERHALIAAVRREEASLCAQLEAVAAEAEEVHAEAARRFVEPIEALRAGQQALQVLDGEAELFERAASAYAQSTASAPRGWSRSRTLWPLLLAAVAGVVGVLSA